MSLKFVELAEVASAVPLKVTEVSPDELVWQVTLDHIQPDTGQLLTRNMASFSSAGSSTHWFDERYVLYSKLRPYLNKVLLPSEKGLGTTELVPILPDASRLERAYLSYFLRSAAFVSWISSRVAGAKMPRATMKDVWSYKIPLPPLEEQKRIAAILDKADAIRKKRQQAVELADQFLKSVFMDMFGDPVTNPKGWDEKRLDNIASVRSGVTKGRQLYGKSTVSAPYMRVANVQDGHLNLDDIQHIEVLQGDIDRYRLMPGDLLLTEGGDRDKLGRGAVWQGEIKDCIHQNHIFCVRSDVGIICPEFLSAQIASQRGKRYFLKVGKQTTGIATINKTALSAYPALVPPMELQEKFIETLTKVHALVKKNKIWDQGIVSNFESLSQRAFKGDLTQTQAF